MGKRFLFAGIVWSLLLASAVQAQSGPVGYWKGDDGVAPAAAVDSSGAANHGSYLNGATTSPAVPVLQFPDASSLVFDGVDDIVDIPTFSWPAGGPVTVAFWSYVATAEITRSSAFSIGNQGDPSRFQAHVPWQDSILYWDYGQISTTGRVTTSYAGYFDKWTHVALVSQGTGGTFKAIYLDGIPVATGNVSGGPTVPLSGMTIGTWQSPGNFHRGKLDDFRVYDRVLTASQIQLLAGGFGEPGPPTLTAVGGVNSVHLSWTSIPAATQYNLKRSTVPGGPYSPLAIVVSPSSYVDAAVLPGTRYYYVMSAVRVSEGPDSAEASALQGTASPSSTSMRVGGSHQCGALGPEGVLLLIAVVRIRRRIQRAFVKSGRR